MVIINTPHNPTGSVLQENDLLRLERLLQGRDIMVLSDEVYEHLIFENIQHQSVCRFPNLARRSLLVGSFGKTFHATGWKIGFVLAPENLMREFGKRTNLWFSRLIHLFNMPFPITLPIRPTMNTLVNFIRKKGTCLSKKLNLQGFTYYLVMARIFSYWITARFLMRTKWILQKGS